MPISNRTRDVFDSLLFFAFVAITALCLSFTFSMLMYQLGVPTNPRAFVLTNLLISGCVALPTGVIASQHEFRLKSYQRRLEALAATDPLTGLYNRRFFKQALEDEIQRMRRTHETAGLVLFDLDHFKRINDRFGHKTGDLVLQEVAAAAFAELRGPFDRLGRWGGVCERIRERIASLHLECRGEDFSITASFGTCLLKPGAQIDMALETADAALFQSKNGGRNRVTSRRAVELAA